MKTAFKYLILRRCTLIWILLAYKLTLRCKRQNPRLLLIVILDACVFEGVFEVGSYLNWRVSTCHFMLVNAIDNTFV